MAGWSLVAVALAAWVGSVARGQKSPDAWRYCPFVHDASTNALSMGETPAMAKLVDQLETAELDCIATCVEDMQALAEDTETAVSSALAECDACVRAQAKVQREVAQQAVDSNHNVGCKLPAKPQDACYVSVKNVYEWRHADGDTLVTERVEGGWWDLPENARRASKGPGFPKHKKDRYGVPSDGLGSVFSFLFVNFAAALESGCTFVFSAPVQMAHGSDVDSALDFFRLADSCIDDKHTSLKDIPSVLDAVAGTNDRERRLHRGNTVEAGRIYFASHSDVTGSHELYTFKLSILRNAMYICHRRHASVLARLILRAKYELGQNRRPQLRAPAIVPSSVAAAEPKSKTQAAQSAWFDPLGTTADGKMLINMVVHVRRGDVKADASANSGVYALHYTPMNIVTTALETLMAVWTPLADKLGVRFALYVASEGADADEFPRRQWERALDGHGGIEWKLRPQLLRHQRDNDVMDQNLTALQTMGQMLDADVLLADGRSDFSLAGHAWSPSSLFLTYPWLLNMGEPLDGIIDLKQGDASASLPPGHVYGMHAAYEEVLRATSHHHPGTLLLERVHQAPEYREELDLMYRHQQHAVLEGMLANIVAKKKLAMERGAHTNWVLY